MTSSEISKITSAISEALKPWMEDLVKQEVEGRIHVAKQEILNAIGSDELRAIIQDAVRSRVYVEVKIPDAAGDV